MLHCITRIGLVYNRFWIFNLIYLWFRSSCHRCRSNGREVSARSSRQFWPLHRTLPCDNTCWIDVISYPGQQKQLAAVSSTSQEIEQFSNDFADNQFPFKSVVWFVELVLYTFIPFWNYIYTDDRELYSFSRWSVCKWLLEIWWQFFSGLSVVVFLPWIYQSAPSWTI